MNKKQIAAALVAPAAIAGVVMSTGAAASAATAHHAQHHAQHHATPGKYHQWVSIRRGDTLSGVAGRHHMSWQTLWATPPNTRRLDNPNVVTVGERLRIPADPKLRAAQFAALWARTEVPAQQPAAQSVPSAAQQPAAQQPAAQAPAQPAAAQSSSAGESSFEQCVSWRESSNDPTDPDGLFGILPSTWASLGYSGSAGQASVAQQKAAFSELYARDGVQPWAPSDGC